MPKLNTKPVPIQNKSVIVHVCFVLFIVCFVHLRMQLSTSKQPKIKQNIEVILIAGMPSSQALPGFLITAPASVCIPDLIGVLAVWISNQKKKIANGQLLGRWSGPTSATLSLRGHVLDFCMPARAPTRFSTNTH